MPEPDSQFVSRAGLKLAGALDAFGLEVRGLVCADLGCNVGGFTDCLLQRGAARVYAVDTGYGALAWKLRTDPRVTAMERTNALYAAGPEPADFVCCDVSWTPQSLIVPAAARWLRPERQAQGMIVSLLKPHYELAKLHRRKPHAALTAEQSRQVCLHVCEELAALGFVVLAVAVSSIRGKGGNEEFLLRIARR